MANRAIEILAFKLAVAEANVAILQARLEEADKKLAEYEIEQLKEGEHHAEHE